MTRYFDVNVPIPASEFAGNLLFRFKEIAVQCGWSVIGSGDGIGGSRYGWAGIGGGSVVALPGSEQGSGGAYDCWQTGVSRTNASVYIAGDAGNRLSWCLLEHGPIQILLACTDQASGYPGYGRIAFNPGTGAVPKFTGPAAADTLPGAATDESWLLSASRASAPGVALTYASSGACTLHLWGSDVPGSEGITPFGFIAPYNAGVSSTTFVIVAPTKAGSTYAGDPSPCVAFAGTSGIAGNAIPPGRAWNPLTGTVQNTYTSLWASGAFWSGQGSTIDSRDPTIEAMALFAVTPGAYGFKGVVHPDAFVCSGLPRAWGNYGLDVSGQGWLYMPTSAGVLVPWPDTLPAPNP